jgi:anti-sigma factor RsiW
MNLADFQDRLDALGADLGDWPAAERVKAERLLDGSEAARGALASARALEGRLSAAMAPPAAPAATRAAVLRVPQRHPRPTARRGWHWGLGLAWGGSLAAALGSLALGFVLGAGLLPQADDPLDSLDVAALVYGAEEDLP